MKQRGRKSVAALAVADPALHVTGRPVPAPDLTEMQRHFWVEISNSLPADWWDDANKSLLAAYCRTLSTLAFLDAQIDEQEQKTASEVSPLYFGLLKRREAMVKVQFSQATKMRLSQQSRYGARGADGAARKNPRGVKPWQLG